ncbi:MAG TPA: cupin domain-containing protein [Myxococcales bacterium]|nr:cupin domain-containing protein [Myxococcales bacterium]
MPIELAGGCRVSRLREGEPREQGTLRAWQHAGRESGAAAISLRVLDLSPGRSPRLGGADCDEVLYAFEGAGTLISEGGSRPIGIDTGFYIPPGTRFEIEASAPMTLVSSRCPDPKESVEAVATGAAPAVVRLDDCISETTGDRWYKVLLDHHVGRSQVTQFVGAIPPGRAPDHYHEYEEVLCILRGRGRMWAGDRSTPIERGSCIYLPRRQMHCVENTGDTELRLLGVFYPSGSPAVRYYETR